MNIAIDAGHGKETAGKRIPDNIAKVTGNMREWEFNSAVATKVCKILQEQYKQQTFRTDDESGKTDIALNTRTAKINQIKPELSVSIHANGGGGTGIETLIYKKATCKEAVRLATIVQNAIIKATGMRDRGIKEDNFAMIRDPKCPAILIECGFMDTEADAKKLLQESYRQTCAEAIVAGIAEYLNIKPIEQKGDKEVITKEVITTAEMKVNGKTVAVQRILKDNRNYVQLDDLKKLGVIDLAYDEKTKLVSINNRK